jgi:hypothetical protein
VAQKMTLPVPKSPATVLAQNKQKQLAAASSGGGYGASRGRQIPISLKTNVSSASNDTAIATSNVSLHSTSAPSDLSVAGATASRAAAIVDTTPTPMDFTTSQHSSIDSSIGVGVPNTTGVAAVQSPPQKPPI